jgi:hypothetical protein
LLRAFAAIGGFEIDMIWQNSKIMSAAVKSSIGGLCKVTAGRPVRKIVSGKETIPFKNESNGVVAFHTEKGKQYRFIF